MKDTRPIDVQVAELTKEQKRTIPKIYKYHLIFSIAIIALLLIALLFSHVAVANAKSDWDLIEEKIESIHSSDKYKLYGDRTSAIATYEAAVHTRTMVAIIGGIAVLILALGSQLYISKKFPYYSEKKYTYLKKAARQG